MRSLKFFIYTYRPTPERSRKSLEDHRDDTRSTTSPDTLGPRQVPRRDPPTPSPSEGVGGRRCDRERGPTVPRIRGSATAPG